MQALVNQAEKVLAEDRTSSTLLELHGLILALSKKVQTLAASEEIDRMISQSSPKDQTVKKMTTTEDRIESLKEIYRQFLLVENEVSKQRAIISANVLAGSESDHGGVSRGLTTRLSLTSRLDIDQGALRDRMESFIVAVKHLESRMKLERLQTNMSMIDRDDAKSFSAWSGSDKTQHSVLSELQSAFDVNPATFDDQKKQMSTLVEGLHKFNDKLAKGYDDLKSDSQSMFSESKSSVASTNKISNTEKSPASRKSISYFSRSGQKEDKNPNEYQRGTVGNPMEATKERNITPSSPSQIKPRLSVIDKIKSQLQHKEEDNLLGSRIFVDDPIKYSTPPKAENTTDVKNDREANNTPPHEDTSVFHSLSERAFNEAEKMTMNQIWNKIINQTDNLATVMHGKQARDMLKSVQASEFTSMASGSFRGSKNGLVFNEEKNNELENMSAKFIFKKQQDSKAASVKKGLSIDLSDNECEQHKPKAPQSTKHATSHKFDHMSYTSIDGRKRLSEVGNQTIGGKRQIQIGNQMEEQLDNDIRSVSDVDGKEMSVFSGDTPKYFYEARDIKRASATKPVVQEEQPKSEEKGQNLLEKMANSHKYILESQISESEFSKLTSEQDHISIGQPAMHIVANQERVHEKEIHSMDTKPFEIISSEKDTLPDFIDFRKQIYIPIDSVNLKNPVAKNFYTTYQKVINDLPSTLKEVLKNENNIFLDEEFRPLPYSIIENIRNLDYKAERRLEWRRAMYLNPKQRIDIWSPTLKLPIKLETNLPAAHRLAKLFEALINKQLLQEVYIGGSITDGKHEFSLHNQAGVEVRVTIDDFLPASIESGISHPAYIRPVEVSGSLYILSSLLEKAMAKMFGAYSLLHQAPLAAVCQCLFGHDSVIDTHEIKIDSSLSDIANSHGGQGRKALLLACRQDEVEVKLLEQDWSPAEIDRWLLAVRNLYDIKMLIGLEGSPLGTKLASHLFTESSSGLSFKINDNSSLSINLRLAQTKTDGSNNSLTHIEILSQLTLEVKRSWILSSEELGWKDISGLPAGEYILLCRFESFELIVDFYGQADISVEPVSATEYEKIRRGQIRKLLETKLPSTSVLTPIEIDSRHSESDASFRIGNFDKISGKLIKVDGVVNINDWMAEVNGRVVNSVAEKTYIVLTGLEEEFLRLFAKKRDQKSAGIKLIFK